MIIKCIICCLQYWLTKARTAHKISHSQCLAKISITRSYQLWLSDTFSLPDNAKKGKGHYNKKCMNW